LKDSWIQKSKFFVENNDVFKKINTFIQNTDSFQNNKSIDIFDPKIIDQLQNRVSNSRNNIISEYSKQEGIDGQYFVDNGNKLWFDITLD